MRTSRIASALTTQTACPTRREYDSLSATTDQGNRDEPLSRDLRRRAARQKGATIAERILLAKTVCLKRLGPGRGDELGAGRFFGNPKVTAEKIVDSWADRTREAVKDLHILAPQDTSEIHFATRPGHRRGLGPCGHGNAHGVLAHVMMALDADSRACLGLVHGQLWNRPGLVKTPLGQRALSAKESRRWVETAEQAKDILGQAAMVTVITDREGDIYPIWARVPDDRTHVLSRVMSDRCLVGEKKGVTLHTVAKRFRVAGRAIIRLPARPPERPARDARVAIRFGAVEIARPVNEKDRTLPKSVRLSMVEVREIRPPKDVEPLHWRLLTTHPVPDVAKAWRVVSWYQGRWPIEQLFRVSKSQGLGLEDSQLHTAERLLKLTAAAMKAACVDMQLVQERDGVHGLPATTVFSKAEIATIETLNPTLEGRTEKQRNPHPDGSLARAGWVIARLGGWNCYGHPPGPITFHRGTERFNAIHLGYTMRSPPKREVRID